MPEIPRWWFAFQSQGASGGPWIGPSVEETLDSIAAEGVKTVMLQPIGFLCDHVEILYDVDIVFKQYAEKKGIPPGAPGVIECSRGAGEGRGGTGGARAGAAPIGAFSDKGAFLSFPMHARLAKIRGWISELGRICKVAAESEERLALVGHVTFKSLAPVLIVRFTRVRSHHLRRRSPGISAKRNLRAAGLLPVGVPDLP